MVWVALWGSRGTEVRPLCQPALLSGNAISTGRAAVQSPLTQAGPWPPSHSPLELAHLS